MRRLILLFLFLGALPAWAAPSVPWQHPLSLGGGGYWPLRVAVTLENAADTAVAGEPVAVAVPGLAGSRVDSLRVCAAAGQELVFDVRDAVGRAKHAGRLAADDQLMLPAECPAQGKTTLYVYAGNDAALPVTDFLSAGFVNGGFEAGAEAPEGWTPAMTDARHTVSWERAGGRGGSRCVKMEVAAGAEPTWVKWGQDNIPVVPGRAYRVTAWVRAENVTGNAGWFVHVNGDRPQMINQVVNAGGGTYDWKQINLSFTAPSSATTANVGTVLNGTGRAWFDDLVFTALDGGAALKATAGAVERLTLAAAAPGKTAFSPDWPQRAAIRVFNLTDMPAPQTLVYADLRTARGRLRGLPANAAIRVLDAVTGQPASTCLRLSDGVVFTASVPARSARDYYLYFSATRREQQEASLAQYGQLLKSKLNLAPNPSFESGKETPAAWLCSGEAGSRNFAAGLRPGGRFGSSCASFTVTPDAKKDWVGWRSEPIPLQAGATYFYSGFLKGQGITGSAGLNAHLQNSEGKLTATSPYVATRPSISGNTDWTQTSAFIHTPGDCAAITLHLTMNEQGTLQHDGILLCRALTGEVVGLESAESTRPGAGLRVWEVNPLIKVFPDELPGTPAHGVAVESARNEYEPFQLVLRSPRSVQNVRVTVSPLTNGKGGTLPAVKVERIGFVPIDHPSGYYSTELPDWYRRLPQGNGSTDGWAGQWPDPLIPGKPFALAANQAQPLWLTAYAPRGAAPGAYRAQITIQAPGEKTVTLPLRVTVLPFTLPERTRLRVMFDLRNGPGGDFASGLGSKEGERRWLRFMAEHRLGTDGIDPAPVFTYKDGKVTMDATAFDEAAHYSLDVLGMNVCYTPGFFYGFGWAYPPKSFFGLQPFTPEYNDAFQQAYRLFSNHLKEKGWHDKFIYYISDEPHFQRPEIVEQMKKLCALAHAVDPQIPIYSSTWRYCPEWDDALDMWGVGQYGCFPVPEMARLGKAGKRFLFTCDGQMATDTPYLATERMLPYYCYKYGAEGFEFWGLSWWTFNPWERGWHSYIRQSDDGKKSYYIRYPNGDGFLTYPGAPVGVEGPVSTIRLEQVREGLEDYEALAILTDLAAKAKQAGRSTAAAEHALQMARNLVTIPNAGGLRSTDILPDPNRIPAIRKAVNAAIVGLTR